MYYVQMTAIIKEPVIQNPEFAHAWLDMWETTAQVHREQNCVGWVIFDWRPE